MTKAMYDPQGIEADVFSYSNMTGVPTDLNQFNNGP